MPSMFHFPTPEDEQRFNDLIRATDGTEPCFDPIWDQETLHESYTDKFVETWTGRHSVTKAEAQAMCAGCHVLEQCAEYAMKAKEPFGIWGATRPVDRGIKPKFKG